MNYDNSMPIYSQIVEAFKRRIAAGHLPPGERVSSVRELALEWGVNPNTMQKALSALEDEGLLYTERTSGRFITRDAAAVEAMRGQMQREEAERFAKAVAAMGYSIRDAIPLLEAF